MTFKDALRRRRLLWAAAYTLIACVTVWLDPAAAQQGQRSRQLVHPDEVETRRASERRVALVIGNSAYRSVGRLDNPVHDARDMAAALRELGFEVIEKVDQTGDQMKRLIKDFGRELSGGGVGLFYYAGHGVQVGGRNFLIPVEIERLREGTIEFDAVDVGRLLGEMEEAGNDLNIVILDACRSNPFARNLRGASEGWAQIRGPAGTLIAYATSPNEVADDGTGRNGLYTSELLRWIRRPGLDVEQVFKEVSTEVKRRTGQSQKPGVVTTNVGHFYFAGAEGPTAPTASAKAPCTTSSASIGMGGRRLELQLPAGWERMPDEEFKRSGLAGNNGSGEEPRIPLDAQMIVVRPCVEDDDFALVCFVNVPAPPDEDIQELNDFLSSPEALDALKQLYAKISGAESRFVGQMKLIGKPRHLGRDELEGARMNFEVKDDNGEKMRGVVIICRNLVERNSALLIFAFSENQRTHEVESIIKAAIQR